MQAGSATGQERVIRSLRTSATMVSWPMDVVLADAELPDGPLQVRVPAGGPYVTAHLGEVELVRHVSGLMRMPLLVGDGGAGPDLLLAGQPAPVTWRVHGSRLRPFGRRRSWRIDAGDRRWHVSDVGRHLGLWRDDLAQDPVVRLGLGGDHPDDERPPAESRPDLTLVWTEGVTAEEVALLLLLTMTMPLGHLVPLPVRLITGQDLVS